MTTFVDQPDVNSVALVSRFFSFFFFNSAMVACVSAAISSVFSSSAEASALKTVGLRM